MINIFEYFQYQDNELSFMITKSAARYFASFKGNFFQYAIKYVLKFNSKYSFILYELLKSNDVELVQNGYYRFTIDELYKFFNISDTASYFKKVDGKTDFKQHYYSNFNNRILKAVIDDINENTDMKIKYKTIKQSRKIVAIKIELEDYTLSTKILEDISKRKKQKDLKEINNDLKSKSKEKQNIIDNLLKTKKIQEMTIDMLILDLEKISNEKNIDLSELLGDLTKTINSIKNKKAV